jgi:DNA primase catalytic core
MIPAEAIASAKARHDIVGFIEGPCGIPLKRRGKSYMGLCPFHPDTRASLSVDPVKGYWCCLGACSAQGKVVGGDVVEFARRFWNVSLSQALERLGETSSATLRPSAGSRPPLRAVPPPRVASPALLSQVVATYHQAFLSSEKARDYAASRGFTRADILSALPMGYADGSLLEKVPEGSDAWEELKGLGVVTSKGEFFSGRLVVPMRDLSGNVVSLYGRGTDDREPRYLFLPGPRRGLVNAPCAATADELILPEGLWDALSFLEVGIPNAVPLYGTNGFTRDHEALLEKHRIRRVILALDPDEAGRQAAASLATRLRVKGIAVYDVVVPAEDPNALLVREGPERFRKIWAELVEEARTTHGAMPRSVRAPAQPEPAAKEGNLSSPTPEQPSTPTPLPAPQLAISQLGTSSSSISQPSTSQPSPPPVSELPAQLPTLTHEGDAYHLSLGERLYRVKGLSAFGVDRLKVNVRLHQSGRFHVDTFDLYSARSRTAFVETAAKVLHLPEDSTPVISEELSALIEVLEKERLALRAKGEKTEVVAMTPEANALAMSFLRGDILSALRKHFLAVGLVGEETALLIGYFALVSRKLREPLSILFCARSGAGKSALQDRLCDFCPPEDLVKYTRISGQVLFYKDENALRHKLLAVDEEDGAAKAAYALRSLLSAGYLTCSVTRTDPHTGRQHDDDRRVNGPTTVFTTTAHPEGFDYETRNRYVLLAVDESREQTRRILELQRWSETLEGLLAREGRQEIYKLHHDAQKLLEPLDVIIPVELGFPSSQLILRREQKKYHALIKAIALLHQHQRPRRTVTMQDGRKVEYVEATREDVEIARPLASVILRRNLDELSPPSRSLYVAMRDLTRQRKAAQEARATESTQSRPDRRDAERRPGPSTSAAQPTSAAQLRPAAQPTSTPTNRRYVLRPAWHDDDEGRVLLDRRDIEKETGLSAWHVKTYMPQLLEYEYVGQVTGRKGKRCLYEVLWDEEEEALLDVPGPESVAGTPHLAAPGGTWR